jgi:hypothetical protein
MGLITGLTTQEVFPREDLTADNAALLELLLSNEKLRTEGHTLADQSVWAYLIGHQAIMAAGRQLDDFDTARRRAFAGGIVTYEAASAYVRLVPPDYNRGVVRAAATEMTMTNHASFFAYLEEADGRFRAHMPNMLAVVQGTVELTSMHLTEYAIHGAALACQLELQVIEEQSRL